MSKVVIDNCLKYINSRFELVILASKKARSIMINNQFTANSDKAMIIALQEIENGNLNIALPDFKNNDE